MKKTLLALTCLSLILLVPACKPKKKETAKKPVKQEKVKGVKKVTTKTTPMKMKMKK